jgi:hypothetical protein
LRTQVELENILNISEESIVKIESPDKSKDFLDDPLNEVEDTIQELEYSNDNVDCVDFFESISCEKCDFISNDADEIEKHYRDCHTKKVSGCKKQCTICGVMVKNLKEHMRVQHTKMKRFFCDKCPYSCYFKTKITRHLMKHIPKSFRELFPCTVDGCQFGELIAR